MPSRDPRRLHLEALADVNRKASRSGSKEELYASQKALADALNGVHVTPTEMRGTDLSGIDLGGYREPIRCRLDHFHFDNANLSLVNFSGSIFDSVLFYRAKLDRTVAIDARFNDCIFQQTFIDAADFSHARFRSCFLESVAFGEYPKVEYASFSRSWVSQAFHDYLKGRLPDGSMPKVAPRSTERA